MRHICLYIGVKIFSAGVRVYGRAGPPEVVHEALADLKMLTRVTVKSCSSFCLDMAVFTCEHSHTVDVLHVPVHRHNKNV